MLRAAHTPLRPLPRRLPLVIFMLLFVTYAYFCQGGGWNSNSRLALTRALAERGGLSIDAYHQATGDKAKVGAHYYTDKSPGPSFLAVPVYALARTFMGDELGPVVYVVVLIVIALPSCLAAVCLLWFLHALRLPNWWAVTLTLGYALGTMALPYATLFYNHQLAASLSLVAFYLTAAPGLSGQRWKLGPGRALLIGTLLGWSAISDYCTLLVAVAVVLILLRQTDRWFGLIPLALGFLLPLAAFMSYNTCCFGGPLQLGYRHEHACMFKVLDSWKLGFGMPRKAVLWQITFGAYRGLFRGSPFLLMIVPAALIGLWRFWRKPVLQAWPLACWWIVSMMLMANCMMTFWEGGFAAGPRFLVPALPFGVLLLAGLPNPLRWATAPLLLCSIGLMLATTAVNPEVPMGIARPWSDYTWPRFRSGQLGVCQQGYQDFAAQSGRTEAASNVGEWIGLRGGWSLLPLGLIWLVGGAWVVRRRDDGPPDITRL